MLLWGIASCPGGALRQPRLISGGAVSLPDSLPSRFTLVSWNTHKEHDAAFRKDLGRFLDSSGPELLLLQEARLDSGRRSLDGILAVGNWRMSPNLSGRNTLFGVLTIAKAMDLGASPMLSPDGEPLLETRKAILLTRYRIGPETLLVANVHALNFSPIPSGFRRQLLDLRDSLAACAGPAVVAGDFNTWSARKLGIADSILAGLGMASVDFGGGKFAPTRMLGHSLDGIYHTPRWLEVDSSRTRVHGDIHSSDHVPIQAGFRLRSRREADSSAVSRVSL